MSTVPIPSATVLLLRDSERGLEVFLLRRHSASDVLGGAYVFPGGKQDAGDVALIERLDLQASSLREALGEPDLTDELAGALHVTAIRELFEEAGVLLAAVDDATAPEAWAGQRAGRPFKEVLASLAVPLQASRMAPLARWITPLGSITMSKRFDARFFVATLPPGQQPVHDGHEATEGQWWPPGQALRAYLESRMQLAPPQVMSLLHLARHSQVASLMADVRSRAPACIQPEIIEQAGRRLLCFPGDELHPVRERAQPGPTRLVWRNARFEPEHLADLGALPSTTRT